MSKKHTSGPWEIEPHSTIDKCFNVGPGISIDYDDVDHEEQDANARLIAAAPELLEALCLANNWLPDLHKAYWATLQTDKREALIEDWNKIKATIKKAKGE